MLTEGLLALNDGGLKTKCSPMTVAEGRDVLATLINKSQALLRAGDLPAQDRGGISHDLRVGAGYGLSAFKSRGVFGLTNQGPSRSRQRHGRGQQQEKQ